MGSSANESQDQSSTATVRGRRSLEDGHHSAADQPLPARAPIAMTLPRQQQINKFVYNRPAAYTITVQPNSKIIIFIVGYIELKQTTCLTNAYMIFRYEWFKTYSVNSAFIDIGL